MRYVFASAVFFSCVVRAYAADELAAELKKYDWRGDGKEMVFLSFQPSTTDPARGDFSIYVTTGEEQGISTFYSGKYELARGRRQQETVLKCKTELLKQVANGLKDANGRPKALTFPIKEDIVFRMTKDKDETILGRRSLYAKIQYESDGLRIGSWEEAKEAMRFHAMKKE